MERVRIQGPLPRRGKTVLTPTLRRQFCKLIKRGLPPDGACDLLGIPNSVFWKWLKRGDAYINGGENPPEWRVYGSFISAFKRAYARYRLTRIDRLHKSSMWVRELAILERRDRKSFGRNDPPGGAMDQFDPDDKFL